MSSTEYSSPGQSREPGFHGELRLQRGGHWSAANIAAMVIGFVLFAPLGFAVLVWTLLGHPIQDLPGWLREKWSQLVQGNQARTFGGSDNSVFNEYQQTQFDRIREIKEEIRKRADAFRQYRNDAKRRQDRQEFDDFMANRPVNGHDEG